MRISTTAFACVTVLLVSGWAEAKQINPQVGERFHRALKRGDMKEAARLLGPNATITENGTKETRKQYISHHLRADAEFAKSTTRKLTGLQVTERAEQAILLSTTRVTGTFRGRSIDQVVQETLVLEKFGGKWVILHIHWSSKRSS